MSTVETLRCDECGKLRVNDSNHWLVADKTENIVSLAMLGDMMSKKPVHLCGQECAMKWVGIKIGEL